jgi:hypothetical protein
MMVAISPATLKVVAMMSFSSKPLLFDDEVEFEELVLEGCSFVDVNGFEMSTWYEAVEVDESVVDG